MSHPCGRGQTLANGGTPFGLSSAAVLHATARRFGGMPARIAVPGVMGSTFLALAAARFSMGRCRIMRGMDAKKRKEKEKENSNEKSKENSK